MEIYRAMCARREKRWQRRRNEVALWLCICNAINVLHEPYMHNNNPFVFYPHCTTRQLQQGEETVTSLLLFRIQLFFTIPVSSTFLLQFFFSCCKFIFKQIASHSTKNYFLIHFHFILFTTELFSSLSF